MESADRFPIFHVTFRTQHLLASTFLRFQEYYESPEFRDKTFDWEEFMDWYAERKGKFSYLEDWTGFNIPSYVFRPFRHGFFDPLTRKEATLLRMFEDVPEPFYVIGTTGDADLETSLHEIVHGLFFVDEAYRKEVEATLVRDELPRLRQALVKEGYHESVFTDEMNAYLLTGLGKGMRSAREWLAREAVRRELEQVFTDHFGLAIQEKTNRQVLAAAIRRIPFPDDTANA